ncbi:hypothetical protein [Paenibacillus sp. 481]|uniref:hypothetical protein n=1 Tax=Paenibacillus sp. 481 TaxID=2835869 RepID=UPI001E52CB40|nr:hypothetical protein [Paenibacillus sp. 481]UHA74278.1 hypothetical protein KIK04_03855 [Paenibacillus sp. 481]
MFKKGMMLGLAVCLSFSVGAGGVSAAVQNNTLPAPSTYQYPVVEHTIKVGERKGFTWCSKTLSGSDVVKVENIRVPRCIVTGLKPGVALVEISAFLVKYHARITVVPA